MLKWLEKVVHTACTRRPSATAASFLRIPTAPQAPQQPQLCGSRQRIDEYSWMKENVSGGANSMSPLLTRHLHDEDAYARATLKGMGVPKLQQQLLLEMRAREPTQVSDHERSASSSASDPPPERIGTWLYWHTNQGSSLLRRLAPLQQEAAAAVAAPSSASSSRKVREEGTAPEVRPAAKEAPATSHVATAVGRGGYMTEALAASASTAHAASSATFVDDPSNKRADREVTTLCSEGSIATSTDNLEVVVDDEVLCNARDFAFQALGIQLEAALGVLKLSRCQRFVAMTLPMSPAAMQGTPCHDVYCCVVRDISTGLMQEQGLIPGISGIEFSADSSALLTTHPDELGRPCEVRMYRFAPGMLDFEGHAFKGASRSGLLIHQETDPAVFLALGHTKDWAYITVNANSKTSSEVHLLDAWAPWKASLSCVQPRIPGLEYFVEHCPVNHHLYILTNLQHQQLTGAQLQTHGLQDQNGCDSKGGGAGGMEQQQLLHKSMNQLSGVVTMSGGLSRGNETPQQGHVDRNRSSNDQAALPAHLWSHNSQSGLDQTGHAQGGKGGSLPEGYSLATEYHLFCAPTLLLSWGVQHWQSVPCLQSLVAAQNSSATEGSQTAPQQSQSHAKQPVPNSHGPAVARIEFSASSDHEVQQDRSHRQHEQQLREEHQAADTGKCSAHMQPVSLVDMDMFNQQLVLFGRTAQGMPCVQVLYLPDSDGTLNAGDQQGKIAGCVGRVITVPLPAWALNVVPGANADPNSPVLRLLVSSPVHPPHTYDFCTSSQRMELVHVQPTYTTMAPFIDSPASQEHTQPSNTTMAPCADPSASREQKQTPPAPHRDVRKHHVLGTKIPPEDSHGEKASHKISRGEDADARGGKGESGSGRQRWAESEDLGVWETLVCMWNSKGLRQGKNKSDGVSSSSSSSSSDSNRGIQAAHEGDGTNDSSSLSRRESLQHACANTSSSFSDTNCTTTSSLSDSTRTTCSSTHTHAHNPYQYHVLRLYAPSHDGVSIPITLVHHMYYHRLYQQHLLQDRHKHGHLIQQQQQQAYHDRHYLYQEQLHRGQHKHSHATQQQQHQAYQDHSHPQLHQQHLHLCHMQPSIVQHQHSAQQQDDNIYEQGHVPSHPNPPSLQPPLLLHVYGAYGTPLDPGYEPATLSLLERGYQVAYAHVRGGGELGRGWHASGRQLDKPNSLKDLQACLSALHAAGFAHPGRVAGHAFSAGGLILGCALAEAAQHTQDQAHALYSHNQHGQQQQHAHHHHHQQQQQQQQQGPGGTCRNSCKNGKSPCTNAVGSHFTTDLRSHSQATADHSSACSQAKYDLSFAVSQSKPGPSRSSSQVHLQELWPTPSPLRPLSPVPLPPTPPLSPHHSSFTSHQPTPPLSPHHSSLTRNQPTPPLSPHHSSLTCNQPTPPLSPHHSSLTCNQPTPPLSPHHSALTCNQPTAPESQPLPNAPNTPAASADVSLASLVPVLAVQNKTEPRRPDPLVDVPLSFQLTAQDLLPSLMGIQQQGTVDTGVSSNTLPPPQPPSTTELAVPPGLLSAAVLRAPFLDLLSVMEDPNLPLTVHEYDEWGDIKDPGLLPTLEHMCPYSRLGPLLQRSAISWASPEQVKPRISSHPMQELQLAGDAEQQGVQAQVPDGYSAPAREDLQCTQRYARNLFQKHTEQLKQQPQGSNLSGTRSTAEEGGGAGGVMEQHPLPAMLVTCAQDDARVPVWVPAKWVARARKLQAPFSRTHSSTPLILLRVHREGGHAAGSSLPALAEEYGFIIAVMDKARPG